MAKCDRLVAPPNSILSGCGGGSLHNVFGDKCLLYCFRGYHRVNGSTERICQANGTWSGEKLHCQGGAGNMNGDYLAHLCFHKAYYMSLHEFNGYSFPKRSFLVLVFTKMLANV